MWRIFPVLPQSYEQRIGCKKTKTPQLIWVAALKNQNKKFILKVVEHSNGEKIHKSVRTCISIGDERGLNLSAIAMRRFTVWRDQQKINRSLTSVPKEMKSGIARRCDGMRRRLMGEDFVYNEK